ncbi:CynX/NimT family MFS transporter [Acidovorax carolinensis]|uniref:MFS transporter n=1 Tax=Acidovorax carolinensis TaxID=553814 RepID=UPI0012FFACA2|nr:MFS transporter [Acidovorax carolinensis]
MLLGIGLRHAVTGLSPLLSDVRDALGMGTAGATLIGMLPTLCFGAAGFLAPVVVRKIGAEQTALLAVALAAAGTLARPFVGSVPVFIALSVVALVGMGMGNVVGAPLVKKYFPDRQASMVTVFALLMQAGATLPAMTAIPVANALGWQASLASWGVLSLVAVVPWAIQLLKMRSAQPGEAQAGAAAAAPAAQKLGLAQLVTSPVALGTALFYAMASLNIYAMLAWLPTILQQHLGLDRNAVGVAFSVYTFMTLPMAFVTPLIANKLKNPMPLAALLAAAGPLGYLGMIFGVGPAWLMTLVAGLAGGAFPLAIAMFNLRTRTTMGSASIAGFAMGIGYLAGTLGPLLGGWLYAVSGSWTTPLWVYVATVVPMAIGGMMMARPGRYLEDKFGG